MLCLYGGERWQERITCLQERPCAASGLDPQTVSGLSSVEDLTAGASHACAIDTNGSIRCWGDDAYAQLGDQKQTRAAGPQ
jgi:alpha-tubulin suppressor-like RCC1 family protein